MTLTEFLFARFAEEEQPTWKLVPYDCPPGCCAPAGWVGSQCRYCDAAPVYGGTVAAITRSAEEHAEAFHQRSRVLAECDAKRQMVHLLSVDTTDPGNALRRSWAAEVLGRFAAIYADHPDCQQEWKP